jgi:hypothetical protein
MRTYDCPICKCSFSEADKSWDVPTESGQCPKYLQPPRNFPVGTKQQEETLPAQQPKLQEENPPHSDHTHGALFSHGALLHS